LIDEIFSVGFIISAMGGRCVHAIVPSGPIDVLKCKQATANATALAKFEPDFASWSPDAQQDRIDDMAAEQSRDPPADFCTRQA